MKKLVFINNQCPTLYKCPYSFVRVLNRLGLVVIMLCFVCYFSELKPLSVSDLKKTWFRQNKYNLSSNLKFSEIEYFQEIYGYLFIFFSQVKKIRPTIIKICQKSKTKNNFRSYIT